MKSKKKKKKKKNCNSEYSVWFHAYAKLDLHVLFIQL